MIASKTILGPNLTHFFVDPSMPYPIVRKSVRGADHQNMATNLDHESWQGIASF